MNQTTRPLILCRWMKKKLGLPTSPTYRANLWGGSNTSSIQYLITEFCILIIFVKHTTLSPLRKRTVTSACDVPLLYSQTKRYSRNSMKLDFHLNSQRVLQYFNCILPSYSLPNLPAPYIYFSSSVSFFVCSNLHTVSPQYPIITILKPP